MKRCAHCGGVPEIYRGRVKDFNLVLPGERMGEYWFACRDCGRSGPSGNSVTRAIAQWNCLTTLEKAWIEGAKK